MAGAAGMIAYAWSGDPALTIGAYAAIHTSVLSFMTRRADRADLDVAVSLEPITQLAPENLVVRVVNRGRRKAVLVGAGVAAEPGKAAGGLTSPYLPWQDDRGNEHLAGAMNVQLEESDAVTLTTPTRGVVAIAAENCRWVFVRPSVGDPIWRRMPTAYQEIVAKIEGWDA